jgi:hypothetical protein
MTLANALIRNSERTDCDGT